MINIITADFSSWNTFTTEKCYMYDKGQILQITGLNLPEYFEVHFSNVENGTAKKAVGHNNFVQIYDEYFETGKPIYCYIVLSQGSNDKKTVYKVTIPILKRSRPVDEQPTPEQQSLIEEALAALDTAQAKADHYADLLESSRAQATTLDYRAFATAEYQNGVFTFGIPRGTPGIQGEPGPQGPAGQGVPTVTGDDNGKILTVKNGAWAAQQKKFIVTLTPTAEDFSGTMNKTVAEINAAYEAGQEIWFRLSDGTLTYNSPANSIVDAGSGVVIFNAQFIDTVENLVLCISTNYSDGGDTYSTNLYSLIPAS